MTYVIVICEMVLRGNKLAKIKKDTDTQERMQRRATKLIPERVTLVMKNA